MTTRKKHPKYPQASWCPECGPVKVDEDGCCAACGCGAMGDAADKAAFIVALHESPVARAERGVARAAVAYIASPLSTVPLGDRFVNLKVAVDRLIAARSRARRATKPGGDSK